MQVLKQANREVDIDLVALFFFLPFLPFFSKSVKARNFVLMSPDFLNGADIRLVIHESGWLPPKSFLSNVLRQLNICLCKKLIFRIESNKYF